MKSFEDLGLAPETVEVLASEGIEEATPFQSAAIPVIRRGNHLLGRAGPGAGTLIAYGAPLLDSIASGEGSPRALVLAPGAEAARRLAESLAEIAVGTGHVVASAGLPWRLPEHADVLFGTPGELLEWARTGRLDLQPVRALVLDQAGAIQRTSGLNEVEALFEFLPKDAQRVVLSLPVTPEVADFVERHALRAVQIPPPAVAGEEARPKRGEVRYRIVGEPRDAGVLLLVSELLEDAGHVCLFFATEDRAADVGDLLALHGFPGGAPGDESVPVWLAMRELDARSAVESARAIPVSCDAPAGPDALDRRHGGGTGGVVVIVPRETAHLRDVARRTGYRIVPFPPKVNGAARSDLGALLERIEATTADCDLAPYLIALEPLLARRGAEEVAAAAVALLRARTSAAAPGPSLDPAPEGRATPGPQRVVPAATATRTRDPASVAFVRLYISLGERDDARPADLLGAITGEAGVEGSQVGRIEIRDTFSIVEVQEPIAERVIRALNGITVRGRSVRADYDRPGSARSGGNRGQRGEGKSGRRSGPRKDRN